MHKLLIAAAFSLIASTAFANHSVFGDNPDLYGSPLLDHGRGDPAGNPQRGEGDLYGHVLLEQPADRVDDSSISMKNHMHDPDVIKDFVKHHDR